MITQNNSSVTSQTFQSTSWSLERVGLRHIIHTIERQNHYFHLTKMSFRGISGPRPTMKPYAKDSPLKDTIQTREKSDIQIVSPYTFYRIARRRDHNSVDCRALNEITIKNRYPIPLVGETLDRLFKAKIFSKFDIIHAFNRRTWMAYGLQHTLRPILISNLVMPFGLCNAPGPF